MSDGFDDLLPRAAFVASVAFGSFLYGFAAHGFGLFPNSLVESAWRQARAVMADEGPPFNWDEATYDWEGARLRAEGGVSRPGLTLISSFWERYDWRPGLRLIDREGRTVHSWRVDGSEIFTPEEREKWGIWRDTETLEYRAVLGTHLFSNGDVLVNVEHVGVARLDACGRVRWSLPVGSHHSIHRAPDGSFWVPGGKYGVAPETPEHPDGLPGIEGPITEDLLLRVSAEGKLIEKINVLDLLYQNGLERHILKGSHRPPPTSSQSGDLTHLNDVEPLSPAMADEYPDFAAGDLLVSLRNIDLVLVVDPDSREVRWSASRPFIGQHDPDFTGEGWIGVFDNNRDGTDRGTMLGGSRIVALQPHTDSTEVLHAGRGSDPFYTPAVGKWQRLQNGNLLLTESHPARVVEASPSGETLWEWVHRPHPEGQVPPVFEAVRYSIGRDRIDDWPCAGDDSADRGAAGEEF